MSPYRIATYLIFVLIFTAGSVIYADPVASPKGEIQVWVVLIDPPLAVKNGKNAKQKGGLLSRQQQQAYVNEIKQKQASLVAQILSLGGTELASVQKAHNAIAIRIDAEKIKAIAALPGVARVRPVVDYELHLSETVPHIGAAALHGLTVTGSGVRVAVLDSGIDYTHRNFEGAGTAAAFTDAYGTTLSDARNKSRDGLFPTGKVVDGWDFVGENWPVADASCGLDSEGNPLVCLQPDEDPIDCGNPPIANCAGGHGTHVGDIIGGHSQDDSHRGVAYDADLYAVKVCSSRSTSCSGVALLQGMDFALDPNGDNDISDAVDVINLSLGSSYGQVEDDLSFACANAVLSGVVVVASAGNSADRPYIVGSPSSTEPVISVAQTAVPSSKLYLIVSDGASSDFTAGGIHQTWSAAPTFVTGPLVYDTTNASTRLGCSDAAGANPYAPGSHTGEILLMDRGLCSISIKVSNAAASGAIAAVIANNVAQAPGELPPSFSFGGGTPTIAGYSITLADGNGLKGTLTGVPLSAAGTIDPADAVSLAGTIVASSSRGPNHSFNAIKPDIGAPGASVSANSGGGTTESAFSGTSGAAPMVSGSVALLLDAFPTRTPQEIKAMLMNSADTAVSVNPVALPGVLVPITRIGGGDVRVNAAHGGQTLVYEQASGTPSLSFGYQAVNVPLSLSKNVVVRNLSGSSQTYNISSNFRFPNDASTGAVALTIPSSISVPANGSKSFKVQLKINPASLPTWNINGGSLGGNGALLTNLEYDGNITLAGTTGTVHIPWQVLPHRAAAVEPAATSVQLVSGTANLTLSNADGSINGRVDVFSLTGVSGKIPPPALPDPGDNFAVIDLRAVGVRLAGSNIQFAFNTFGRRSHPNYPAAFEVDIDVDRDGDVEFAIFNRENGTFASTGQNAVAVFNVATNTTTLVAFADADLDSGNVIFSVPLSSVGLSSATKFDFTVFAIDNYFTGNVTDFIPTMTYTSNAPRFAGSGIPPSGVPAGGSSVLTITHTPANDASSPSQSGLLLMYRDASTDKEADPIIVTP